ncbi:hypothetical protein V6N11_065155 [Hibiscus sabdariffa]|uniref:Zinc knuckle CX2CX4HX4C domain-containing protein n=1 Tax=Hibiscus sabdariffa TaxID=183260 RepID=A0ABR2SJ03_9ROSI
MGRRGKFARMAVRVNFNNPLVSKVFVNEKIQLVEYQTLPTICFNYGNYDHVYDNCPDLQPTPATEAPAQPSEPAPPTTIFGPWMVVEKRQCHPQLKEATGRVIDFTRSSTMKQSVISKRKTQSKSAPPKQTATTLRSKGKSSSSTQQTATFHNSGSSLIVNNLAGEPPKKPPDPIIPIPPRPGHIQENVSVNMQHVAHSVDVPAIVGDAHGPTMLE